MIDLEQALKIKVSLEETTVSPEDFQWGPSFHFAQKRRNEALRIIRREIAVLRKKPQQQTNTVYCVYTFSPIQRIRGSTEWKTSCGHRPSFRDSLPTEFGEFCMDCGGKIQLRGMPK